MKLATTCISLMSPLVKNRCILAYNDWSSLSKASKWVLLGLKIVDIYEVVLVHNMAPINEPADDPVIILGNIFYSYNTFITPTWYKPNAAPPDKHNAVLPITCLDYFKNYNLFYISISPLFIIYS